MGSSCTKIQKIAVDHPKHGGEDNQSARTSGGGTGNNNNDDGSTPKKRKGSKTLSETSLQDANNGASKRASLTTGKNGSLDARMTHADSKTHISAMHSPKASLSGEDDYYLPTKKQLFSYKKGQLLGKGAFGEVFECLNLNTGELLAVKTVKISGKWEKVVKYIKNLKQEISLLKTLNHKNVVKYHATEVSEQRDEVDIILEYVSGGSVRSLLDKFHGLDERVVSLYTKQILEGLEYLHNHEIIHRDIKGANVLIDANGTIKLSDFGCSKKLNKLTDQENPQENSFNHLPLSLKGSPYWMAPEVVLKKGQGKAADIWSVGCVVIEMLTGRPPWSQITSDLSEIYKLIISGAPPNFPSDISENCRSFLYATLKNKPEERPTCTELLEHPFVAGSSLLRADSAISMYSAMGPSRVGGGYIDGAESIGSRGFSNPMYIFGGSAMGSKPGASDYPSNSTVSMSNIQLRGINMSTASRYPNGTNNPNSTNNQHTAPDLANAVTVMSQSITFSRPVVNRGASGDNQLLPLSVSTRKPELPKVAEPSPQDIIYEEESSVLLERSKMRTKSQSEMKELVSPTFPPHNHISKENNPAPVRDNNPGPPPRESHDSKAINSKLANQLREDKEREEKEKQRLKAEKRRKWEEELKLEIERKKAEAK
jgi:serine/threonine protein kinase